MSSKRSPKLLNKADTNNLAENFFVSPGDSQSINNSSTNTESTNSNTPTPILQHSSIFHSVDSMECDSKPKAPDQAKILTHTNQIGGKGTNNIFFIMTYINFILYSY